MKININLESLNTGNVKPRVVNADINNTNAADSAIEKSSQTVQDLSKKRSLVDTIIISQIAQNFFQKAVLISSRLKSIATEAIASGKMRGNELTDALKDIKSSLNEMQEGIAGPGPIVYNTDLPHTEAKTVLPQINNELKSLNEFANDLSSGTINLKKIDRINKSLTNKMTAADNSYGRLVKALTLNSSILSKHSDDKYPEITRNAASQIIEYPQVALKSQGNISYKAVKNLL